MELDSGRTFSTYVFPKKPMTEGAERETGISVLQDKMYVHGEEVQYSSMSGAADKLLNWLEGNNFDQCVFMAHNGRNFDSVVLTHALHSVDRLEKFVSVVPAFLDTIQLFKDTLPKMGSYQQKFLVQNVLQMDYRAHDAVEDITALRLLVQHANPSFATYLKHTFSSQSPHQNWLFLRERDRNAPSLHKLQAEGVVKHTSLENIAGSGLNYQHLQVIFRRKGRDGLRDVLGAKNAIGKARAIASKRLLDEVVEKMSLHFEKLV